MLVLIFYLNKNEDKINNPLVSGLFMDQNTTNKMRYYETTAVNSISTRYSGATSLLTS